jgi:hypothetical protein
VAPYTVAQQPAVRHRAAWRGTRVTEPYAASVAAVRRYYQWCDTMVCNTMRIGAAKKISLVNYFCQKFIINLGYFYLICLIFLNNP